MKSRITSGLLFFAILCCRHSMALEIRHVQHDIDHLAEPGKQAVTIRYELSDTARVSLDIYDGRNLLVRSIPAGDRLQPGNHMLAWDGMDNAGKPVPPGAYVYTLTATDPKGNTVVHDLSDLTGGIGMKVEGVGWDATTKTIRYVLKKPAWVNIRIGLKDNGPLLRTLIDWVPRAGGLQQQAWDGKDESGLLDLGSHPERDIHVQAFSSSDNTILVGEAVDKVQLVDDMPWGRIERSQTAESAESRSRFSRLPLEARSDFSISLKLPADQKINSEGIPVVSGDVPLRLDIDESDRIHALEGRTETIFYVDGVFVYENEAGFLPTTWKWNTQGTNPGVHYVTANLLGYNGNAGVATVKVYKEPETRE